MIVQCQKCLKYFDDEFRNTDCHHDTFGANDGLNNFKHYPESYLSDRPLGEGTSYQNWLNNLTNNKS
jgi:hypothetical protein